MDPKLQEKIDSFKKQGLSVRKITLGGKGFIYRSLNRQEYRKIQDKVEETGEAIREDLFKKYSPLQEAAANDKDKLVELGQKLDTELRKKVKAAQEAADESLILEGLVDPVVTDLDSLPPGVIATLSTEIMKISGFEEEPQIEEL